MSSEFIQITTVPLIESTPKSLNLKDTFLALIDASDVDAVTGNIYAAGFGANATHIDAKVACSGHLDSLAEVDVARVSIDDGVASAIPAPYVLFLKLTEDYLGDKPYLVGNPADMYVVDGVQTVDVLTSVTIKVHAVWGGEGKISRRLTGKVIPYLKYPQPQIYTDPDSNEHVLVGAVMPVPIKTDYWILNPCEIGDPLYASNDLAEQYRDSKIVKVAGNCYTIAIPSDTDSCANPVCYTIEAEYVSCLDCNACWTLTPCSSGAALVTSLDLSAYSGKVVKLDDDLRYTVSRAEDCSGAVEVVVKEWFENCSDANVCYNVENCFDAGQTAILANNLPRIMGVATPADTINKVIEYGGRCWKVTSTSSSCTSTNTWVGTVYHVDCPTCGAWKLTPCDGGSPKYTRNATNEAEDYIDLNENIDEVIRLTDHNCYTIELVHEGYSSLEVVTVMETYASCSTCKCYKLQLCGATTNKWVYNDLDDSLPILKDENGDCWEIIDESLSWETGATRLTIVDQFETCENCLETVKYLLTNSCSECDSAFSDIVTTTDLHAAVGKWVKVEGACYKVSTTEVGDSVDIEYQGPYDSCEACLNAAYTGKITVGTGTHFIEDAKFKEERIYLMIENDQFKGTCPASPSELETEDCDEVTGYVGPDRTQPS